MFMLIVFPTFTMDDGEKAGKLLEQAKALHAMAAGAAAAEKQDLLKEAEGLLRQAIEIEPGSAPLHVTLVKVLWEKGEQLAAFRLSQPLTGKFPSSVEVWMLEADLNWAMQKVKNAIDAYQRAIELGADEKSLILRIGSAYAKMGDIESAFECYDKAIEMGIAKEVGFFNLGLCYEASENYVQAHKYYMRSLSENESYIPVLKQLALFYQKELIPGTPDLEKALKYAKKAVELVMADEKAGEELLVEVVVVLLEILFKLERYEDAYKLILEALERAPGNSTLIKYKRYLERKFRDKKEPLEKDGEPD
jgi:pentatricopeptide repeat protein